MVDDEHTSFRENIPAFALGALDVEDASALEAHLQTCASCRTELAAYRAVSDNLLIALPPQAPPASLRRELQSRLPGASKTAHARWTFSFGQLAFGIVLAALLILNLFSLLQLRSLQRQQAQLISQVQTDQMALAILSYPGTQTFSINGESVTGTILLNEDHNTAVLVAWDLPLLAENQIYQIWLVEPNGHRVSAGLFRPEIGKAYTTQIISAKEGFSGFTGIGVTVEPAGGSDQPTGSRVFKVDF